MRETNTELGEEFPPELQAEIGGQPSWHSSCDANLLIYSVMVCSALVTTTQAYNYLKELQQAVVRLYPELPQKAEYIPSL